MLYEVELKFCLTDAPQVLSQLASLGAIARSPIEQVDRYFNHPSRDFRQTDEAFRIRSVGTSHCVTYKGPVIDRETKMRREIEIPFADGPDVADQAAEMLTAIGFRSVFSVHKTRTPYSLTWNGRDFELALDVVPKVGTFLEIELVVDESGRDAARDAILGLAGNLGLTQPERRSYLEIVMTHEGIERG
jgi:adenylate cyclase class 2